MRMNDLKEMVIMFLAAKTVNKTTNDIKDIIYILICLGMVGVCIFIAAIKSIFE